MAVRTSSPAVRALMAPGYDYDDVNEPDLGPFIRTANRITTGWVAAVATYRGLAVDTDTATDMESWLAAWLFKLSDQQYSSKNSGRSSANFRGMSEKGLRMNTYGEGAIALDAGSGYNVLLPMMEGRIAGTQWVGKLMSEKISYDERNGVSE